MSQPELLKLVARRLEAAGIEYMITGSVASSLQGEPRATHDIDVVVAVPADAAPVAAGLKAAFPEPDFYLDEAAVRDAIVARGMFNLIDTREGDKVDFWLLTDDAFDRARFGRRYVERFQDARLSVSRPEDTILMKLAGLRCSVEVRSSSWTPCACTRYSTAGSTKPTWSGGRRRWVSPTP